MNPGATTGPVTSMTVPTAAVVDRRRGRRRPGSGRRAPRHRPLDLARRCRRRGARHGGRGRRRSPPDDDIGRLARNAAVAHLSFDAAGPTVAQRDPEDGPMTVEALRRRRPETLADLLETYGRELQSRRLPDPARPLRGRGRRHRDAPDGVREGRRPSATSGRCAAGSSRSPPTRRSASGDGPARIVRLDVVPDRADHGRPRREQHGPGRAARRARRPPPQMRAAVVLRYYADLSVEEVATALGKSPNTIKAQLQTALDRLRIQPRRARSAPASGRRTHA